MSGRRRLLVCAVVASLTLLPLPLWERVGVRVAWAGHCNLLSGGAAARLTDLTSRPGNELSCNSLDTRSGFNGAPTTAPGFNPMKMLEMEQDFESSDPAKSGATGQFCDPATGVNCTDRLRFSRGSIAGHVTGNMFGRIVDFDSTNNAVDEGSAVFLLASTTESLSGDETCTAGATVTRVFNTKIVTGLCSAITGGFLISQASSTILDPDPGIQLFDPDLQSILVPAGAGALPEGRNDAGQFAITPFGIILASNLAAGITDSPGQTAPCANNTPDLISQCRPIATVSTSDTFAFDFAQGFGNDFVFNPSTGTVTTRSRLISLVETGGQSCAAPSANLARSCSRLTVLTEHEGSVGDERSRPEREVLMTLFLASFSTLTNQSDGTLASATSLPTVTWRQRIDQGGLFIMDTQGDFLYSLRPDASDRFTTFPTSTYPTGRFQTQQIGVISPLASLTSIGRGVCIVGNDGSSCPGP